MVWPSLSLLPLLLQSASSWPPRPALRRPCHKPACPRQRRPASRRCVLPGSGASRRLQRRWLALASRSRSAPRLPALYTCACTAADLRRDHAPPPHPRLLCLRPAAGRHGCRACSATNSPAARPALQVFCALMCFPPCVLCRLHVYCSRSLALSTPPPPLPLPRPLPPDATLV